MELPQREHKHTWAASYYYWRRKKQTMLGVWNHQAWSPSGIYEIWPVGLEFSCELKNDQQHTKNVPLVTPTTNRKNQDKCNEIFAAMGTVLVTRWSTGEESSSLGCGSCLTQWATATVQITTSTVCTCITPSLAAVQSMLVRSFQCLWIFIWNCISLHRKLDSMSIGREQ